MSIRHISIRVRFSISRNLCIHSVRNQSRLIGIRLSGRPGSLVNVGKYRVTNTPFGSYSGSSSFAPPPSRPKSPTAPSCELILPETGDSAIALTRFLAAVGSLAVICAPPFTAVRTPTSSAANLPPSTPAVTEPCQPASS